MYIGDVHGNWASHHLVKHCNGKKQQEFGFCTTNGS